MINISAQEVKDVLQNLNVTKAAGPDLSSPQLLKKRQLNYMVRLASFLK